MPLTVPQIRDLYKTGGNNKRMLSTAMAQERRLKLHTKITTSLFQSHQSVNEFLEWARLLLPRDKYAIFVYLFRYPVHTTTLTEEIFTAMFKMFDGKNPVINHHFFDDRDSDDFHQYNRDKINIMDFFQTKGFEASKAEISSVMVVDLPKEQAGEMPEPYMYLLKSKRIVNYKLIDTTQFEWIMFKADDDHLAVFCDGFFRLFKFVNNTIEIESEPTLESEHNLGFCPARTFWTDTLDDEFPMLKKAILSGQLSNLDELLFFWISANHLNLYARFPVTSSFAFDCDYKDEDIGDYCDDGFLRDKNRNYIHTYDTALQTNIIKRCPVCSTQRFNGAGSHIYFDPPNDENEQADFRDPYKTHPIDRDSLDYNKEDLYDRKMEILCQVTGYKGAPINDQAVNKKQVVAIFESLESALRIPQRNMELAMQWTFKTICLLRYGADRYGGSSVSLGTEHYIMTAEEILAMYDAAKKAGSPTGVLDILQRQYIETKFRNNPDQIQRQAILLNLDPFRHLSLSELQPMLQNRQIKVEDYMLKANLSSLVMRFERENMSILEFASAMDFGGKITSITNALKLYVVEMQPANELPEPPPDDGDGQ